MTPRRCVHTGKKRPGDKVAPPSDPKLVVAKARGAPYTQNPEVPGKKLHLIEQAMRRQVKARSGLHATERDILLRTFAK